MDAFFGDRRSAPRPESDSTLVCLLAVEERVPIYHRIAKGRLADDGKPVIFTFCGRHSSDWPSRVRLEHAKLFAEPCITCWPHG